MSPSKSSQADSPAKTCPTQDEAQELKGSVRVFGQSTPALLASFNPATSWWRTSQLSLLEDSGECLETWPRSGMTRSGTAYRLRPLVPLTAGIASGLLPTPAANPAGWRNVEVVDKDGNPPTHANQRWYDKKTGRVVQKDLRHVIERGMWPTPTARDHKDTGDLSKVPANGLLPRVVWRRERERERHEWSVEPDVGRVADGVPARVDRLRALGNALVPQVAEWIGCRVQEWEEGAR